ncbi:hypothetical protein I316_02979 [Kwoniella heveanensis BCC8398]|uniref:Uncharacterized protein n=1 Tax=Kwoniella heveanensis BCC8398 TaxID=1296120 RepID=A0A1B9GWL1_9TREE|nr:hypothetical protein I316_02979 [Kwoniella heveanensis BCC8398]
MLGTGAKYAYAQKVLVVYSYFCCSSSDLVGWVARVVLLSSLVIVRYRGLKVGSTRLKSNFQVKTYSTVRGDALRNWIRRIRLVNPATTHLLSRDKHEAYPQRSSTLPDSQTMLAVRVAQWDASLAVAGSDDDETLSLNIPKKIHAQEKTYHLARNNRGRDKETTLFEY